MMASASRGTVGPPVGKLDAVQVLRAAAATVVVLGHVFGATVHRGTGFVRPDIATGWGVDLFFLISGFIMVVSSRRMFAAPDGARDFLLRRLVRIVPLYWGVTTLALLLAAAGGHHALPPAVGIAASYAFVPFDTAARHDGFAFPIVDLGWTLNYEMLFYLLFALFMRAGRERCVAFVTLALAVLVVGGAVWPPEAVALRFWTRPIMLEFAGGMWLALGFVHGRLRLPAAARIALAVAAVAVLAWNPIASLHLPTTPNGIARVIGWGLPAAALLAAAISGAWTAHGPAARGAVLVGDSSYALYLMHPFWLLVLDRLAGHIPAVGSHAAPFAAIALAGAILVAVVAHRLIELPVTRALTHALRRGGAPIHGVPLTDGKGS